MSVPSKYPINERQLQLPAWEYTHYLRCKCSSWKILFHLEGSSLFTWVYDHFHCCAKPRNERFHWDIMVCFCRRSSTQVSRRNDRRWFQYVRFSSNFRIVFGLHPKHFQGILGNFAFTRHAARFSLDMFGVGEGILNGLLIIKAWPILIIVDPSRGSDRRLQFLDRRNSRVKRTLVSKFQTTR